MTEVREDVQATKIDVQDSNMSRDRCDLLLTISIEYTSEKGPLAIFGVSNGLMAFTVALYQTKG